MEHKGDINLCAWNGPQMLGKEAERAENQRTNRDYQNYSIVKIGQNTEKSPGNLGRLGQQIDQRTRKHMTIHKASHLRDDVDKRYVSRKEGGRGLTSIQDSIDASIQRLGDYIKKVRRKTDYNKQKQYIQHKNQPNKKYQKTKIGSKTTV